MKKKKLKKMEICDANRVKTDSFVMERILPLVRKAIQADSIYVKQWYLAEILNEADPDAHYDYQQWCVDVGIVSI